MIAELPFPEKWLMVRHRDAERVPFQAGYLSVVNYGTNLTQANGFLEDGRSIYVRYGDGSLTVEFDGEKVFQRPLPVEDAPDVDGLRMALEGFLQWP